MLQKYKSDFSTFNNALHFGLQQYCEFFFIARASLSHWGRFLQTLCQYTAIIKESIVLKNISQSKSSSLKKYKHRFSYFHNILQS